MVFSSLKKEIRKGDSMQRSESLKKNQDFQKVYRSYVVFSSIIKKGDSMKYSESLKKNKDFQQVYRHGTSKANRYLVMYVLDNQYMKNRLGISVSKKVGNSVVRHRLTRLIRESYRLNEAEFENSLDIVVVARPQAKDRTYQEIESALMHLAGKHCIAGKNNDKEVSDQNN